MESATLTWSQKETYQTQIVIKNIRPAILSFILIYWMAVIIIETWKCLKSVDCGYTYEYLNFERRGQSSYWLVEFLTSRGQRATWKINTAKEDAVESQHFSCLEKIESFTHSLTKTGREGTS